MNKPNKNHLNIRVFSLFYSVKIMKKITLTVAFLFIIIFFFNSTNFEKNRSKGFAKMSNSINF